MRSLRLSLLLCALSGAAMTAPADLMGPLLGIPYVQDAAQDERGRWVTFTHPDIIRPTPGFNCSGFTIACARRLLGYSGTLEEATRDRLGDSGPGSRLGSRLGRDWDFAWDLVLNLSEGRRRRVLLPAGEAELKGSDGRTLRGFPMEDATAWGAVLPRIRPGWVYLCSLSRETRRGPQHYHAVILMKEAKGPVRLYQTLPKGRSHGMSLDTPGGMARAQRMFGKGKRILVLEVEPGPSAKP